MTQEEIINILNYSYPLIKKYYGKGKLDYPSIELHQDIYARLSGDEEQRGEHSKTSIAQYDKGKIFIYYPNVKTEEDILRALIHEYTHYTQDSELFAKYRDMYSYDEDPTEIEAKKNEEDWHLFTTSKL